MTTHHPSPEDAFDRWLDTLVDDEQTESDDDRADTAAFLQHHFALPPAKVTPLPGPPERLARPPQPSRSHTPTTSSRKPLGIVPAGPSGAAWHVASLVAAAILALIALAAIGAVLRMGDDGQHGSVSATASMLPFAPASVLASPTPAATCTTDDTLLLIPEEPVEPGAFADLPFEVAWYADGTITVERSSETLRKIEIGDFSILRPTPVPNVIHAFEARSDGGSDRAAFVNIETGEVFEVGAYQRIIFSDGPYAFWVSDDAHTHWHAIDLRSFETADLNEQFAITPLRAWTPYASPMMSSDDGTVMIVGTTTHDIVNRPAPLATPIASDGPVLEISRNALLINGNLDSISVIGPLAISSSAMTVSADGATAAWLAPSDRTDMRTLTIHDLALGDVIAEHPIDVTYNNSLLFNADGSALYATSGDKLEILSIDQETATPAATAETITLPDTSYQIVGASPDRTKLLLARTSNTAGETSLWVDLATGETRELRGQPARMWESTFPMTTASKTSPYTLIDDFEASVDVVDMATGETVMTVDRNDGGAQVVMSSDASAIIAPHQRSIDWLDVDTGTTISFMAPTTADEFPQSVALTSDGDCAVVTWWLDERAETVLLSATSDRSASLPPSMVGGWVPSDAP